MLDKLPGLIFGVSIAAVVLLLTVGVDSPDDATRSCERSYYIAPDKPFSSPMVSMKKNPGLCRGPNIYLGEDRVMDGGSWEVSERAIQGSSSELDRAVFSAAQDGMARSSVCAQYRSCLRKTEDIKITLLGGIWRLFLWSLIAGTAIAIMRRVGTETFLARAIPLILAFIGIAVFGAMEYWGEEEYGNTFSVLVSFGALYFGFVAVGAAADTCVEQTREFTDAEQKQFVIDSEKATKISKALVMSAGMMAPNISRNFRVNRTTTIDELGYSKYLSDLNIAAIRKWAGRFADLLRDVDVSVTTDKAEQLIKKGMVKASGGREMMNLEVLNLGQLTDSLLPLMKLKNWTLFDPDTHEYRIPSAFLLKLRIESEDSLKAMSDLAGIFATTQAENHALAKLMCGDRIVVANKENCVLGVGEVTAVPRDQKLSGASEQEHCEKFAPKALKAKRACKVRWFAIAVDLSEGIPLSDVASMIGASLKGRAISSDLEWHKVKKLKEKFHNRTA